MRSAADVEDLAMTYGVPVNATVAPGGPVRPLCVVKVGGEVITKDLPNLIASLRFLRDFGLLPVVVHGGGPQLNDELAKAGVEPSYIGGHRVTDAPTMMVAKRVFEAANAQLAGALAAAGLPVQAFPGGVFRAEVADPKLGLVGRITRVDGGGVNEAIAAGRIPVLTSLGLRASAGAPGGDGTLNINADVAARELAIFLQPLRVVFISAGGGWKEDGSVISELNMANDYERMAARDYTGRQGTLLKLNEMKAITDKVPGVCSVTICSASALISQLLPHKGLGTQIRKGTRINRFSSAGQTDAKRLAALLQACSGDAPSAAAALALLSSPAAAAHTTIYTTENYDAAAIVDASRASLPRLQTLLVSPSAAGQGMEAALWTRLRADFPRLAWVSPPSTSPSEGRALVASGGPAAISRAFPAISASRAGQWAEGSCKLPGGGAHRAMWWGLGSGKSIGDAIDALAALSPSAPAAAAAAAAVTASAAAPLHRRSPSIRVGLLGARGFVGREFVSLIGSTSSLQVVCAASRANVGQPVAQALGEGAFAQDACAPGLLFSDIGPKELAAGSHPPVDVWVLALPNGHAAVNSAAIEARAKATGTPVPLILDLSADMRFEKKGGEWVYGFPEAPGGREALRGARKISNPGCYATGAQSAILPLLDTPHGPLRWEKGCKPHIFGVSGYSGAGTTPSDKNDPARLRWVACTAHARARPPLYFSPLSAHSTNAPPLPPPSPRRDNLLAYSLVNHIHEREVAYHCGLGVATQAPGGPPLGSGGVAFMPHVAPFFQGIHLTVTGTVAASSSDLSPGAIAEQFGSFYQGERLITVLPKDMPDVARHGTGKHGVTLGGFTLDPATRRLALVSCIDNLLKGAATQALQNINLALGLEEYDGIPKH